jgi:hypothetical protein
MKRIPKGATLAVAMLALCSCTEDGDMQGAFVTNTRD